MAKVDAHLKKKLIALSLSIFASAALTLGAIQLSLFTPLESVTWDARLKYIAPHTSPDPRIRIITIDQSSIDHFAREEKIFWPWPRALYAPVLKFLERGGASVAALDILFTEPSSYGVDDDQTFAEAMRGKLPIVVATALRTTELREEPHTAELFRHKVQTHGLFPAVQPGLQSLPKAPTFISAQMPIRELLEAAAILGNVSADPDSDGIFRHISPIGVVHGLPILNLPFAVFAATTTTNPLSPKILSLADREGKLALRFAGPARTYTTYPIAAIIRSYTQLEAGEKPLIDPAEFKDALVLIGMDAPGLLDLRPTPLSEIYPGVEYNATALDNLLHQRFIRKVSPGLNVLASITLTAFASAAALFLSGIVPQIMTLLVVGSAFVFCAFSAALLGIWILMAAPLTIAVLTVTLCFAYQYQLEGRQLRFLRHAFKHYVSSAVIDQIVENPASLAIGGERRELTMFFSDIEGFTTISEALEPTQLVRLLNMFLSEMAAIIMESGGTVDKYVGDAIIAFWNAPLSVPDHAQRGVLAALACQKRLAELAPIFQKEFGVAVKMRIGLHTGAVNVGNFGSRNRFNYTMIGDAANLASRLEGANKAFGTYILASAHTIQQLPQEMARRKVADIIVVGKKNTTSVYEPLPTDGMASEEGRITIFNEGLTLFEAGELVRAKEVFANLPNDSVARRYIERINSELTGPFQKEHWAVAWSLSEK